MKQLIHLRLILYVVFFVTVTGCIGIHERYRNWRGRMDTVSLDAPLKEVATWAGPPAQTRKLGEFMKQQSNDAVRKKLANELWVSRVWRAPYSGVEGWAVVPEIEDPYEWWKDPRLMDQPVAVYRTPNWYRSHRNGEDLFVFGLSEDRQIVVKFAASK